MIDSFFFKTFKKGFSLWALKSKVPNYIFNNFISHRWEERKCLLLVWRLNLNFPEFSSNQY
jgi:hypothetical protein